MTTQNSAMTPSSEVHPNDVPRSPVSSVGDASTANAQERRIRTALGLTRGPLPKVQTEWLRRYFKYLTAHLSLPFVADCPEDVRDRRRLFVPVTVVGLLDPDEHEGHEELGLRCRVVRGVDEIEVALADVEVKEDSVNFQHVEDYWYWFWNWRFDPKI